MNTDSTKLFLNKFRVRQDLDILTHINPFQHGVAFHIKTSHLFCFAKQSTGFYMKTQHWTKIGHIASLFGTKNVLKMPIKM